MAKNPKNYENVQNVARNRGLCYTIATKWHTNCISLSILNYNVILIKKGRKMKYTARKLLKIRNLLFFAFLGFLFSFQ